MFLLIIRLWSFKAYLPSALVLSYLDSVWGVECSRCRGATHDHTDSLSGNSPQGITGVSFLFEGFNKSFVLAAAHVKVTEPLSSSKNLSHPMFSSKLEHFRCLIDVGLFSLRCSFFFTSLWAQRPLLAWRWTSLWRVLALSKRWGKNAHATFNMCLW